MGHGGVTDTTAASFPWLRECQNLFYWGDMDASGLEILDGFRAAGLRVTSVLMVLATYERYEQFGTSTDARGNPLTAAEIGWMVLPEFQGRGIATTAVRILLLLAREQERWGLVHAFPAIKNAPSNAVCRSAGFRFAGEQETAFAGRMFRTNHWVINPATDLTTANARPSSR